MVPKGLMYFGPLCMQLRAPCIFFLLFGTKLCPEKVQHFLVSPISIKIAPTLMFFSAATGSGVLLCWGGCTKSSTFLRDPPHPSQNWNFHLIDKIVHFLHSKLFFPIAMKDLHYYWASAQYCTLNNTFFSLWECPKMGSHISRFLCAFAQKEFFSDGPKGIECILDLCAYSWERQLAFLASGNAPK